MRGGWLVVVVLCFGGLARADETVSICYNYGCVAEASVVYAEAQLTEVGARLARADDAVAERAILAQVVGQLYRWAGEQSPIHADRAGDFLDDGVDGRMDCIDHAESTTRLLRLLEARGMLRFHEVDAIRRRTRWLVAQHFSAVIRERADGAARFVVDSWFGEHGEPAVILPLEDWLDGEGPHVS